MKLLKPKRSKTKSENKEIWWIDWDNKQFSTFFIDSYSEFFIVQFQLHFTINCGILVIFVFKFIIYLKSIKLLLISKV